MKQNPDGSWQLSWEDKLAKNTEVPIPKGYTTTFEQLAEEERKNLGASMSLPERLEGREERLKESIRQYNALEAKKRENTSARKFDSDKPRMELLSRVALEQMAQVLTFGAKKYDAHNWRKGMDWSRLYGAAMRHILASLDGEDLDPESGFPHIAHAAVNLMFLLEYSSKGLGTDDRYKDNLCTK